MIDRLAVLRVQSLTVGGTDTATETALLKYDLMPGSSSPDVLLNAYSTNDMHVKSMLPTRETLYGPRISADRHGIQRYSTVLAR